MVSVGTCHSLALRSPPGTLNYDNFIDFCEMHSIDLPFSLEGCTSFPSNNAVSGSELDHARWAIISPHLLHLLLNPGTATLIYTEYLQGTFGSVALHYFWTGIGWVNLGDELSCCDARGRRLNPIFCSVLGDWTKIGKKYIAVSFLLSLRNFILPSFRPVLLAPLSLCRI